MTRHLLPAPDGASPDTRVVVGWDRRMCTFFLQIHPPEESDTAPVWLGQAHAEIYDLDAFEPVLARHGIVLPDLLVLELFWDRDLGRTNLVTDWRSGHPVPVGQG